MEAQASIKTDPPNLSFWKLKLNFLFQFNMSKHGI